MPSNESCLTENGGFVAATATFNEQWEIISSRHDKLPSGYLEFCKTI
jgi:hypothetical protein